MTAIDAAEPVQYPGYEEMCPWHHRMPFDGVPQEPRVVTRAEALYQSWAPAPGNSTPSWLYVSTARVNCGVFYVQPGGWFDSGNHPNPEQYYVLAGTLHLANPDTSDVIEITAGDASNIPARAFHHAWNLGTETCEILWWVPGEMHTDEFKASVDGDPTGDWRWYPREPVMLGGPHDANDGFASRLHELERWPSQTPKGPVDMQKLDRSTWLHLLQGGDPRLTFLRSYFYCDEQIRCGQLRLPASRETEPEQGAHETLIYVTQGALSVNLTGTGRSLLLSPGDLAFLPPGTRHGLQAIGDEPVVACFAEVGR